jgi:hypothetical protein
MTPLCSASCRKKSNRARSVEDGGEPPIWWDRSGWIVIWDFLPGSSPEELEALANIDRRSEATSLREMGRVMKVLVPRLEDGRDVRL